MAEENSEVETGETKTSLAKEFSRIHNWLGYRRVQLLSYLTTKDIKYTFDDGREKSIGWVHVDRELVCLDLKGLLASLAEIYPQITLDNNFQKAEKGLEDYRKKKTGFWGGLEIDEEVLKQVSVYLEPIKTKTSLAKDSIESLEQSLFKLRSQDPRPVLEKLVAYKKDTNPVRTLAGRMKEHVADTAIWRDYRNTWKRLNKQLKLFGINHYGTSEEIITAINGRYSTSDKLNTLDMRMCNEFMNEIIDVVDVYDSMIQ